MFFVMRLHTESVDHSFSFEVVYPFFVEPAGVSFTTSCPSIWENDASLQPPNSAIFYKLIIQIDSTNVRGIRQDFTMGMNFELSFG